MIFLKICLVYCVLWLVWWVVIPIIRLASFISQYNFESLGSLRDHGNMCYNMTYHDKKIKVITDFSTDQIKTIKYSFYELYDFTKYSVKKTIKLAESDPNLLTTNIYYNHYLKEGKTV